MKTMLLVLALLFVVFATPAQQTVTSTPYACTPVPLNVWTNVPLASQTGTVEYQFDVTPSASNTDGVVGLSSGAATGDNSLAVPVLFSTLGTIQMLNGAFPYPTSTVTYVGGARQHITLDVNITSHTYDGYVGTATRTQVATNYAWRTAANNPASLSNVGAFQDVGTGTLSICNLVVLTMPPAPFVLKSSVSSLAFAWTVGAAAPATQTFQLFDSSPCPPVSPILNCAWPATLASDSSWLTVTPASGTTQFNGTVGIVPANFTAAQIAAGSATGHINATATEFTTPTLTPPITVTVTITGASTTHKVSLSWKAATLPTGASAVTGYNVLKGTAATGPFTQIGTTTSSVLVYVDSNVTPGQTPCYAEQAVNSAGSSLNSNVDCVVVP